MAWIKKHPHLLTLIIVAVAVLAASGLIVMNAQAFNGNFEEARKPVMQGTKVYQQETKDLEAANAEFTKPAIWSGPKTGASLFAAGNWIVEGDALVKSGEGSRHKHSRTGDAIPNQWFIDFSLPLFAADVTRQDADKDGFVNEDEWLFKTDPNNAESHPPYHTQLYVDKYIRVPFVLQFLGYIGEPEKPDELSFQINAQGKRSKYLKMGDEVDGSPGTKFKLKAYLYKKITKNEIDVEVSELTLTNTSTGADIVLIYRTNTDSPDSYAQFKYCYPQPGAPREIRVKQLGEFVLLPEKELRYKLLDINDSGALIKLPNGEEYQVPKLPAGYPPP